MNRKAHFITFGVVLQLVQVLSCNLPSFIEGSWQDDYALRGRAHFTPPDKFTWYSLKVGGESKDYICVDGDSQSHIYVWRSTDQLSTQPGKYIYVCMLFMGYTSELHAYYLITEPNPDADDQHVVLSEDANLKKCDVCSTRSISAKHHFSKQSETMNVRAVVDKQALQQKLNCKSPCEEYLDVYTTLLINIIQKIRTTGIKCDDQGYAYNNGNGEGRFYRSACECFRKLNENLRDFSGIECNELLLSQK